MVEQRGIMAEAQFDDLANPGDLHRGAGFSAYINGLGAVLSLALVAGVVAWGYQLAVRDVAGVPVVRALDGPMRVRPDDPGGVAADHLGLAVNRVQAEGLAEKPAERLVLAPTPVALEAEDQPQPVLAAAAVAQGLTPRGEIAAALSGLTGDARIETAEDMAVAAALAQALIEDEPVAIEAVVDASSEVDLLDDLPAPISSVRPVLRPKTLAANSPSGLDVDPASLTVGTRLVQLGAFESRDQALAEWTRLNQGFEPFMADKNRIVQMTETSGRVFYRLRAVGFSDLAHARRFCAAILASQASCIPVLIR